MLDASGLAERIGIKVHVVRAGEFKGAGMFGTEVTDEQLSEFQRIVNGLNEQFLDAVQTGRNMSRQQVEAVADGRVHIAAEAVKLGLIDAVGSFDSVLQSFTERGISMATNSTPATIQQLKTLPKVTDSFVIQQLESNATFEAASSAWMSELAAQASLPGVDGLGGGNPNARRSREDDYSSTAGSDLYGDAQLEFKSRVEALVDKGVPRMKAVQRVRKADPGLVEQMIADANEGRRLS